MKNSQMQRLSRIFNVIAAAMTLAFLSIFMIHMNLVTETEKAMKRSSVYDSAWVGTPARMEILNLQKALGNFSISRTGKDAAQVSLFSEIMSNRFKIFEAPGFQTFLDTKPGRRQRIETAVAEFDAIRPALASVQKLDFLGLKTLKIRLEKVFEAVDRVGAETQAASVQEAAEVRAEVQAKQELQAWLVGVLFASIVLLLGISIVQNRFLRLANREALRNADDFSYLAHHDSLTGLPNRMAFTRHFAIEAAACGDCETKKIAILAIDLDGFKNVNDRLGHATGDTLLKEVAKRMQLTCETFGNAVLTARIGGDEFVVILDASSGNDGVFSQAEHLRRVLSEAYTIEGSSILVGASLGIAISIPGRDPKNLLIDADIALAQAKVAGKGRVLGFDPSLRDTFLRHALIEAELASAIANDQIVPHYQIKMDVRTGRVSGVEALARWSHPTLGTIPPGEFVQVAEESGLIVDLGRKILEKACRDALHFPAEIGIAVNLSPSQFIRDDILRTVRDVLKSTGLPAHRLTLEVTETLMISEANRAVEILSKFREMGISVALDDFGTGYSALSYLRQFQWDELKIDRSFVMETDSDERARAIVGSIAEMAHLLGIKVTAEGAETAGQVEALRAAGCDTIQGYHFGRPVCFAELPLAILQGAAAADRLNLGGPITQPSGRRKSLIA